MAWSYTFAYSTGTAGETHTAQLVDTAGVNVGGSVTTGFVGLGAGFYLLTVSIPDQFVGALKVLRSGTLIAVAQINPHDAENSDARTSSRVAAGGHVTYTGPVAPAGNVTVIRGDDYNQADGRALEWSTVTEGEWPDLTGATIGMKIETHAGGDVLTVAGSVATATGASKRVRAQLSSGQTSAFAVGSYAFDVQATLASGRKVTLVRGTLTVLEDLHS